MHQISIEFLNGMLQLLLISDLAGMVPKMLPEVRGARGVREVRELQEAQSVWASPRRLVPSRYSIPCSACAPASLNTSRKRLICTEGSRSALYTL